MKPCVVGIGGAGGNILKQFLQSLDLDLVIYDFGGRERLTYGDVKGIWLESATHDAQNDHYYGSLIEEQYPAYLICHGEVKDDSPTKKYVKDKYGFDLKAMGYDRRAEYLKGLFEIFEFDDTLKGLCSKEFKGYDNPLSGYMWRKGILPFVTLSIGGGSTCAKAESKTKDVEITATPSEVGEGTAIKPSSRQLLSISAYLREFSRRNNQNDSMYKSRCDSILFLASLGGGTGTGFINPITSSVRSDQPMFTIFALGILTERGLDKKGTSEGQRDLGAVIAMYDLLTKEQGKGIDGLILMDNQILKERFNWDLSEMDGQIYRAMKPLLDTRNYPGDKDQDEVQAIRRVVWEVDIENAENKKENSSQKRLLPSVLVPCYHFQPDWVGDVNSLVKGALGENLSDLGKDGRLFPCDPTKAERALVFTRGFFGTDEIKKAVERQTGLAEGKIRVYRKLGDSKVEDMLILLRNPYGGEVGAHGKEGTLEWRFHDIINKSIKYIQENEMNILGFQSYKPYTKDHMRNYFYEKGGIKDELLRSIKCLERGRKPFFCREVRIFGESTKVNQQQEQDAIASELDEQITHIARREAEKLLKEKGLVH